MNRSSNSIIMVKGKIRDVGKLCDFYLGLPPNTKRFFHPFPFDRTKVIIIFSVMIISEKMINIIKSIIPKMAFVLVVAYNNSESKIVGFAFLLITGRECDKLVANCGGVTREGDREKGIGTKMYSSLIERARRLEIGRFRITVMEENVASLAFHKKFGFVVKGYTRDDYWDGNYEKNLSLELELR